MVISGNIQMVIGLGLVGIVLLMLLEYMVQRELILPLIALEVEGSVSAFGSSGSFWLFGGDGYDSQNNGGKYELIVKLMIPRVFE